MNPNTNGAGPGPTNATPAGVESAGGTQKVKTKTLIASPYSSTLGAPDQDGSQADARAGAFLQGMLERPADMTAPAFDQLGPWQEHAISIWEAWQSERDIEVVRGVFASLAGVDPSLGALVASPLVEEDEEEPVITDTLMPDLPARARLSERLGSDVGGWLQVYVDYAMEASELTPTIMHEAAGLWLASVAIARRLHVVAIHDDIFPNLYALGVAPTTVYAKSTGMRVATRLLDDCFPHLLLASEHTPQALLASMAGQEPANLADLSDEQRQMWRDGRRFAAQRGMVLDEASALLVSLRREYMQGMAELLLQFHDCPIRYALLRKGSGLHVVQNAYLSILGWTTPSRLRMADLGVVWADGLLSRFGLLTPEGQPVRPSEEVRPRPTRPAELPETLSRLGNALLPAPADQWTPAPSRAVEGTAETILANRRYLGAIHDLLTGGAKPDERLFGTYGRLPAIAMKVSLLLAALDWSARSGKGEPVITLAHYAAGQRIAERWRASAHRLLDQLSSRPEAEQEDADTRRAMQVLDKQSGRWLTFRDLQRGMGSNKYTSGAIEMLISTLAKDGRVEVDERKREGPGRQPSRRVRILSKKKGDI